MTEYSATLCIVLFVYFSTLGNIAINNYMDGRITDCTALLLYCIYYQPPECALCVFVCVCLYVCVCLPGIKSECPQNTRLHIRTQ